MPAAVIEKLPPPGVAQDRQRQLNIFTSNLPKRPYCTDDFAHGLIYCRSSDALQKRYIQPNKPNERLWLMYDVDRATSPDELTDDLGLPPPNLFIQNPANQHAHVLYSLEVPVHMNDHSSYKAIKFAGAVDCGLSVSMGADAAYVGLITKNPLHKDWRTIQCAPMPYDLPELSDFVDLDLFKDRRVNLPEVGLGRNVNLFNRTRKWAYRARNNGWPDFKTWHEAVLMQTAGYNNTKYFTEETTRSELPHNEVRATANSIAKWTWHNFSTQDFSAIQAARGRKSGAARREQAKFKEKRALQLLNDGLTQVDVAQKLKISTRQIRTYINRK